MQNLYNALVSPIPEFKDDGLIEHRPPSPVMLRAARAIQALAGENANNHAAIMAAQVRESGLLADIDMLRKEIEQFKVEQKRLYDQLIKEKENDQSICDGRKEASDVGGGSGDLFGSNPSGEGDATNTDGSPSPD